MHTEPEGQRTSFQDFEVRRLRSMHDLPRLYRQLTESRGQGRASIVNFAITLLILIISWGSPLLANTAIAENFSVLLEQTVKDFRKSAVISASGDRAMTVYYVNANTGSDSNTGRSEGQALASLSAVSKLSLKPGDSVLFSADSVFTGQLSIPASGSAGNPITFGSYGEGDGPVISGGETGIYGSKRHDIVIENLTITDTKGNAIYAGSASNWVVNNVTVTDTGSASKAGSISFQSSSNITITNSTITDVNNGDGIWMKNVTGAVLEGNTVSNATGHNSDAIQINDSSNIVVRDNILDQSGDTGSAKGVLVLVNAKNAVVDGNEVIGGGFGIAAYGTNITITNNDISDFHGYSWSYGIGLGQQVDAINYTISGNYIHDGVWGVSVSATSTDNSARQNINVTGNIFEDLSSAALKVDRPASGTFADNIIEQGIATASVSASIAAAKTFIVGTNETVADVSHAVDALFGVPAPTDPSGDSATSPAPSVDDTITKSIPDDTSSTGSEPAAGETVNTPATDTTTSSGDQSAPPSDQGTSIDQTNGGTTDVPATGTGDQPATAPGSETPTDTTDHVTSPTSPVSDTPVGTVETPATTPAEQTPAPIDNSIKANADTIHVTADTGLVVTGNVLDNDHSGNGQLFLRTFDGGRIGSTGATIEGSYGTIHINADGSFTYSVHEEALPDNASALTERFQYKISNSADIGVGYLYVNIDAQAIEATRDHASTGETQTSTEVTVPKDTTPTTTDTQASQPAPAVVDNSINARNDGALVTGEHGLSVTGNILENDTSGNGTLQLRTFGGDRISSGDTVIEGKYGTISIDQSGNFNYTAHESAVLGASGSLTEAFQYKVSNTANIDTGYLYVTIDTHEIASHYADSGLVA